MFTWATRKRKKDPAKELAKKQRKAAKQERCADKRDRKAGLLDEQQDLAQLIAQQRPGSSNGPRSRSR